jgi:hypothetical protein
MFIYCDILPPTMKPHQPGAFFSQPSGARSSCSDGEEKWPQPPASGTEMGQKFSAILGEFWL